jgi:hypothetical protein
MKKIFTLLLMVFIIIIVTAQNPADTIKYWKKGGQFALNFSQVSLTNWMQGGENSIAINSFVNLFATYGKEKSKWDNKLDLAYGTVKTGDLKFRKSDDKIDFSSMYGYEAAKKWYYSALLNFKSQFTAGYNYPDDSTIISKFLAPAYTSIGIGMEYKPVDYFSLYLSPVTARFIIVNDKDLSDAGAFGVDPGKKVKPGLGALLRAEFAKDILQNVNLKTKLELFSDYMDHPENIDVFWDVFLAMKINKWLAANLNTTLVYDNNVMITDKDGNTGPRTQFKEVFGVGLTYMFP